MASTDALPVPRKNAAFRLSFDLRNSSGAIIGTWTGADSEVSKDGGAFADCTNEATEIGTSGVGYLDLTSTEMNADTVIVKTTFTNTGAITPVFYLYPQEAGDIRVNTTYFFNNPLTVAYTVPPSVSEITADMDANSFYLPNADATVSSRLASASYTSPPTVGAVADAVWDEALSGHSTSGSAGAALTASGSATDPLTNQVPGSYSDGTAGRKLALIGTNSGVISSPVTNSGELLVLSRGASYTAYSTMIYAGRLVVGFVAASNPVKLFIKYNDDEQFVKTISTADVSVTASNINVDISNILTSAVTLGLKEGQFKAQLAGFNGTDNLQANVLIEFSVLIQPPLMDYTASDS